jgi:hypothetical protein
MNPQPNQQPPSNSQPIVPPSPSNPQEQPQASPRKLHKKLALMFLIGPTALILIAVILSAFSNFINSSSQPVPASGDLFGETNPISTVLNIIVFLLGALGILVWLPGIIIGLILLLNKNHAKN